MSKLPSISQKHIEKRIFTIRSLQVMIDRDLAEMYQVETRVLNQAVKRNHVRFPEMFHFQLSEGEFENWKSQIVMSNKVRKLFANHSGLLQRMDGIERKQLETDQKIKKGIRQ